MELDPDAFNALLDHLGEDWQWRKSWSCACLNPNSGSPLVNCPRCAGKGRFWDPPVTGTAGVASSNIQQQWAKLGNWDQGDIVVSIPENSPLYDIGLYDRALLPTSTEPFSRTLRRGAPNDRLLATPAEITRVFWYDGDNNLVEGGIPTVAANGVLTWASGAPPDGVAYSISGTRYLEYFCFGPMSADRMKHHGNRLPRRIVLKRFDLFGQRSGGQS